MNDLIVITGGTGTGKAYLAKELIRKTAISPEFEDAKITVVDLKMIKFVDASELPKQTTVLTSCDIAFDIIEDEYTENKPYILCIGESDMILQNTHRFLNMLSVLCLRLQPTYVIYMTSRYSHDTLPNSILKVATGVYITRYPANPVKLEARDYDDIEAARYPRE